MTETDLVDYYRVLAVARTADDQTIRQAVTRQRRVWLRRQGSADPQSRAEADTVVRNIRRAEESLLDPAARRAYDARLANHRPVRTEVAAGQGRDWLEVSREHLRADNPAAAHSAAREALTAGTGDPASAWFIRGSASVLLGNARDAEFELSEAIRLRPAEPEYRMNLGDLYGQQRRWNDALRQFEEVLRLTPGDPFAQTAIAEIYLHNGKESQALQIMEGAYRDHPENEVFGYFLAITIHDHALSQLSRLTSDSWLITSERQAELIERAATRIEQLGSKDSEVTGMAASLRRMVAEARTLVWIPSRRVGAYAGCFLVFGIVPLFSGAVGGVLMGLLLGGLIATMYVVRHHKPGWFRAAKFAAVIKPGV